MRIECRHYETRAYRSGETVRKCDLDLAPEAPWRCPADCPRYERRTDVGWAWGTAVAPPTPEEPSGEGIAELLDLAEDIVNAAGPDIMRDVQAEQEAARKRGWKRFFRRRS